MKVLSKDLDKVAGGIGHDTIQAATYVSALTAVAVSLILGALLYRHVYNS